MSNDNKTLADVQPGGRVRLPQSDLDLINEAAALSAQPAPGGQGDARVQFEAWAKVGLDRDEMGEYTSRITQMAWAAWKAALAARQPVGVPLWCMHILGPDDVHAAPSKAHAEKAAAALNAFHAAREEQSEHDPKVEAVVAPWPHSAESHAESVADFIPGWLLPRWQVEAIQTDATPTAQAVDLPYSLDADPAGIRARVCDVITGTLMVGAQGHTPPPAGHWAEPFWKAARADAGLQVKMREALWAAARSLRTIADSTKETEFLEPPVRSGPMPTAARIAPSRH